MKPLPLSKKDKEFFVRNYGRSFFQSNDDIRFFLYAFLLFLLLALFFKSKINEFKHVDLTKVGISKKKLTRLYIELAKRQEKVKGKYPYYSKIRKTKRIPFPQKTIKQYIQEELKKSGLLYKGKIDTVLINKLNGKTKIEFELAEEDELDGLLNNFVSAYRDEEAREFELSVRNKGILRFAPLSIIKERALSKKRTSSLNFFKELVIKSDRFFQGYRTKKEIEIINKTVRQQDYLFKTCMMKIKRLFPEKSFFFKLRFNIDSLGKVRRESIRITDTNVKNPLFKSCIIKRCNYFRGFSTSKKLRATDYIFRKKYVF